MATSEYAAYGARRATGLFTKSQRRTVRFDRSPFLESLATAGPPARRLTGLSPWQSATTSETIMYRSPVRLTLGVVVDRRHPGVRRHGVASSAPGARVPGEARCSRRTSRPTCRRIRPRPTQSTSRGNRSSRSTGRRSRRQRGVPDPKKKIGQAGDVVWDTWKTPGEVFYQGRSAAAGLESAGRHAATGMPARRRRRRQTTGCSD